ncbi:ATP6 synthase, partial [Acromyrmex heyeri]
MDIQCIGEKSEFLNLYLTKSAKYNIDFAMIDSNKSLALKLWNFAFIEYLKKNEKKYLINHYRFNVKTEFEKYFYSLLLLFKPWRDLSEIKGAYETDTDTFKNSVSVLTKAMKYHEENNLKTADRDKSDDDRLDSNPIEADDAIAKYTHLSDMVLKTLRDKLKTIELFIIHEISMISNVTYNLRSLKCLDQRFTDSDINVLQSRKIHDVLDTAMLDKIDGDEILAKDDVDCASAMKKKILEDKDDKVSETAGIERVIAFKIGAKVMIRRNIDVTLGFVNGTIGNVVVVNHFVDRNCINSIKIVISDNKEITLFLSYRITIHKSQGITCKNAIMDLGTSVSIRVMVANIIAGHLLLTLLGSSGTNISNPAILLILISTQILLYSLEIAVPIIQAYVFSILSTLYSRET